MPNFVTVLLSKLLPVVLSNISPELRKSFVELLDSLEAKAKTTKSPWDDMFVSLLRSVLGF